MGWMYAPHTVTLINSYDDSGTMVYQATVLNGVFFDVKHSALAQSLGSQDSDSAELFIPVDVDARDTQGNAKSYVGPKQFAAAANKTALWTLEASNGNSASPCYFVCGVAQGMSYKQARKTYDDVYNVTSVLTRDFGNPQMQHWQVGGR